MTHQFAEMVTLIRQSRSAAQSMVSVEMINLYWQVRGYIHRKTSIAAWGDGAVRELADFIGNNHPELKGFGLRALYKMQQFYETYMVLFTGFSEMKSLYNIENKIGIIVSSPI